MLRCHFLGLLLRRMTKEIEICLSLIGPNSEASFEPCKNLICFFLILKLKFFAYLVAHGKVNTRDLLQRWRQLLFIAWLMYFV